MRRSVREEAVRSGWGLVFLLVACGTERRGLDVPLARDCAAPSAQLSVCDPHDEACRAAVDAALRCYADLDPGPAPRLSMTSTAGLRFPRLWLSPLGDRALAVLRVRRPTAAVSVVFSSTVGGTATVHQTIGSSPDEDLRNFAAGLALAHELVERGGLQRFLAAPSLDAQAGLGVLLAGRADLYASFVYAAAIGVAYVPPTGGNGLSHALWQPFGELPVERHYREGGDPEVARLVAEAPGLLELLSSVDASQVSCPPQLPELDLGLIRVPEPMRVIGAVPGGCDVLSLAGRERLEGITEGLLALVEDEAGHDLLVWAVRLAPDSPPVFTLGLPAGEADANAIGRYVHVFGTSTRAQAVADATAQALGGL